MKRDWFVLHVKPRTEKKVASFLSVYGYFYVLPTWTKITKVQRRKVKHELPLFPGYVFTRLLPDERTKMLQTNLLVKTILVKQARVLVHQLRQIMHAAKLGPSFRPVETFKVGDPVRIASGPFMGIEGYVKRLGAQSTLVLNIDILGSAVEVSVGPDDVQKVSS